MTYSRKFNFSNGTFADAEQIDAEFDQIIAGLNTLDNTDTSMKGLAQMMKITSDAGDNKIKISDKTKDLLALIAAEQGLFTVYAISGAVNNPSPNSVRGLAFISGGYGWVKVYDSKGGEYQNYLENGSWQGWNQQYNLWDGPPLYPKAGQTITPSKKLSQCRNGWILVWSDYDVGNGANDTDIAFSYVPKADPFLGKNHLFVIPNNLSLTLQSTTVKQLIITDSTIIGVDDNAVDATNTNDVVLRNVLEW